MGGDVVLAGHLARGDIDQETSSKSSPTDLVTATDRASEAAIVHYLTTQRPKDGILAEEGSERVGTSGVCWVIDPLDGTTNFFYGHPGFSVSIAACDESGPLVGVVLDPWRQETFQAALGSGSTLNGRSLRCRTDTNLSLALVATGFAYREAQRRKQAEIVAQLLPHIRDIRRVGSAALDLCSVAAGRVDAYFEVGLQPWDLAAGSLVAAEAGAFVTDFTGGAPSAEGCIAANPTLHRALLQAFHV